MEESYGTFNQHLLEKGEEASALPTTLNAFERLFEGDICAIKLIVV